VVGIELANEIYKLIFYSQRPRYDAESLGCLNATA
jgi:hypothetical protein